MQGRQLPRKRMPPMVVFRYFVLAIIVLALLFGYQASALYTDWLWFQELRQPEVFSTRILASIKLFLGFGLLFFIVFYFNLWLAQSLNSQYVPPLGLGDGRAYLGQVARKLTRGISLGASVLLAVVMGANAAAHWDSYLQFTHGGTFGVADPIFNQDVGYYVFRLPFISYLLSFALITLGITAAGVAAVYYSARAVEFLANTVPTLEVYVRRHILAVLGIFAFFYALDYWLARYDLLYSDNGVFFGAGYTDVHIRLPAIVLQMAAMLLTSGLCFLNIWKGRPFRLPLVGLALWAIVSGLGMGVLPGITQRFTVIPNQFNMEKPYIAHDLKFTQRAYGVDRVVEKPFEASGNLTAATVASDRPTIDNIRLWDWPQLGMVYTAKQALKTYYRFSLPASAMNTSGGYNIDVDRYRVRGRYRQVMLAARELYTAGLPESAQTWQNQHLQYTHGYGAVMSPVDRVDAEGLPEYLLGQIPVRAASPELNIERPQIYFGELTNDYVFAGTQQTEFDYPSGEGSKETHYTGAGGIPLGGELARFAWSIRLADANMLLSSDLKADSRILFRRNVRDRVQSLAPFLAWDNDPYLVVDRGRLFWLLDGYTLTGRYPYAKPYGGSSVAGEDSQDFNYIRNAVKAVVDAYDGTVTLYVADKADPIARTWGRIFPGLLQPLDKMPESLRAHIRYPEDLFRIQRDVYRLYHITDPRVYYGKEDAWEVPVDPTPPGEGSFTQGAQQSRMLPYYVIMRLPGEQREEFLMMTPFTPLNAQNIAAWMCAKCDPDDYGQLFVYRFPRGSNINGPGQIIAQIKSQPEVSQYQTLMGQQGSRLSFGNLLVIPIDATLLYAVPVYIQASGAGSATIPQIKQVILATGDKVVMRSTLDQAVVALVGGGDEVAEQNQTGARPTNQTTQTGARSTAPKSIPDLLKRASQAYQGARQKQQEYNKSLDDLGAALRDLQQSLSKPGIRP